MKKLGIFLAFLLHLGSGLQPLSRTIFSSESYSPNRIYAIGTDNINRESFGTLLQIHWSFTSSYLSVICQRRRSTKACLNVHGTEITFLRPWCRLQTKLSLCLPQEDADRILPRGWKRKAHALHFLRRFPYRISRFSSMFLQLPSIGIWSWVLFRLLRFHFAP